MDLCMEERLARVIARHREQQALLDEATPIHDRERRLTRERVLTELPRLVSRITRVIAELNDHLSDEKIMLVLSSADRTVAAEAVYTLTLADDADRDLRLLVSVDWSGATHAVLCSPAVRSLVLTATVFDLDEPKITEAVLTLLEARFP